MYCCEDHPHSTKIKERICTANRMCYEAYKIVADVAELTGSIPLTHALKMMEKAGDILTEVAEPKNSRGGF